MYRAVFFVGSRFVSGSNSTRSRVLILGWFSSDEEFLFSLGNRVARAFKMALQQWRAMISRGGGGPTFGGWRGPGNVHYRWADLHIADKCDTNTNSFSNLGRAYQLPAGYSYGTAETQSLLAGSENFKCDEYEVFHQQWPGAPSP